MIVGDGATATPHATFRQLATGLLFISPWLLGFAALVVYPFAASLYWSFCDYDLLSPPRWVGLENYRVLASELAHGGRFRTCLWNTFYYTVLAVPLSILVGVGLSLLLNLKLRGQAVFRALFYLPSVVPLVASSMVWIWLFEPQQGLINHLLSYLGLGGWNWFQSPAEAANPFTWGAGWGLGSKDALVLMSVWGSGNFMIIYLAALNDIPRELYEAAALDGASNWQRLRHITLPMLSPVIFFNLVMGMIAAVQYFTQVYVISDGEGGPVDSTLVFSLHVFLSAFKYLQMGYASAMAWLMFLVILAVTLLLFRTARHWVYYSR